jgi:hypothetical protein
VSRTVFHSAVSLVTSVPEDGNQASAAAGWPSTYSCLVEPVERASSLIVPASVRGKYAHCSWPPVPLGSGSNFFVVAFQLAALKACSRPSLAPP